MNTKLRRHRCRRLSVVVLFVNENAHKSSIHRQRDEFLLLVGDVTQKIVKDRSQFIGRLKRSIIDVLEILQHRILLRLVIQEQRWQSKSKHYTPVRNNQIVQATCSSQHYHTIGLR